jgi:hypothetical protein
MVSRSPAPSIETLPDPPAGKTGWPWTEGTPAAADIRTDGTPWPRISIVTPTLNQGQFIEETIRSVLLQGYPNLEYVVIDGGSTDATLDIIERYAPWIARWVSESDRGTSHALNKGWSKATGQILGWLNSDDVYTRGALITVGEIFGNVNETATATGAVRFLYPDTGEYFIKQPQPFDLARYIGLGPAPGAPGVFIAKWVHDLVGPVNESLHYSMDRDYWIRIAQKVPGAPHAATSETVANALQWGGNRMNDSPERPYSEFMQIVDRVTNDPETPTSVRRLKRQARAAATIRRSRMNWLAGHRSASVRDAWLSFGLKPSPSSFLTAARASARAALRDGTKRHLQSNVEGTRGSTPLP